MQDLDKIKALKQYFTPESIVKFIVDSFVRSEDIDILEPSCGDGAFLKALPKDRNISCCEIDNHFLYSILNILNEMSVFNKTEYHTVFQDRKTNQVVIGDFLTHNFDDKKYDLIIGNPPYGQIKVEGKKRSGVYLDNEFVKKSINLLKPNGHIVFILEAKFLHGRRRYDGIFNNGVSILNLINLVRRPKFSGLKGTGLAEISIFHMCKTSDKNNFVSLIDQISWFDDKVYIDKQKQKDSGVGLFEYLWAT